MRVVEVVHAIPGRLRLRASWLREHRDAAPALGDRVAAIPGVIDVRVRPYTGSVVVRYDPALVAAGKIVEETAQSGDARTLAPGEHPPPGPAPTTSAIARETARFFRELDRDLLRATGGKTDLGTLATLGFVAAGAVEVASTGKLPMPPWFNLAWWGFRTFVTLEQEEIESDQ